MSLLLDALKKAADEKKKNDSASAETDDSLQLEETTENQQSTSQEDDLDLDLEIHDTADDFPTVDEALDVSSQQTENEQADSESTIDQDKMSIESTTDDSLQIENEVQPDNISASAEADNNIDKEQSVVAPDDDIDEKDLAAQEPVVNKLKEERSPAEPQSRINDAHIKNEKALEALINKTNQSTRRNNLKTNISIILIVLIVLIFAAGYYFIQMTTSTQELFIADVQNNVRPVQRAIVPVQEVAVAPEPVSSKPAPVQAAFNTPVKKQSIKTVSTAPVKKPVKKINVIHRSVEDPIDALLRKAYAAFNNEEYTKSNDLYSRVIDRDKNNRDALLGLAAIGIKLERYEYSRQKYLQLLRLDPKDSYARAGLSTIESKANPQLNESQLKFMLREQPEAAHLYFALGSLYASQEKWSEAQSAFFSAWSAENKNADYSYSLAVSLDHLGKKKQAKDFYQLSIKLKQISGGNFSVEDTENRIKFLQDNNS